jgi:hypothetical protein
MDNDSELTQLKDRTKYKLNIDLNKYIDEKTRKEIIRDGKDINSDDEDEEEENKYREKPAMEILAHKFYKAFEIISHYIHAALSIIIAIYTIYYTNLFYNLYTNEKINRFYLILSAILFVIIFGLFFYLSFYLPYFKKLKKDEIDKYFDDIIPYCTLLGLFAFLFLIISMWPVYYFYSILIVIGIFWAIIMTGNFSPNGILGDCFILILFGLMFYSPKFIKHKGHTYY